jgi:dTDP-glucose 4,6-dehydratase
LYSDLVTFVEDRPGHDLRYAVDTGKIKKDFGWVPNETFESGLYRTIQWYLSHQVWWRRVLDGGYRLDRMGEKSI